MLSISGFLQLVLISSQELKQAGAGLLQSAWCHWSPIPPLTTGQHVQSLHFLPGSEIGIFLTLVLGLSLSLGQHCRIIWKYTPGCELEGQEFLQYLVRRISGREHLDKF